MKTVTLHDDDHYHHDGGGGGGDNDDDDDDDDSGVQWLYPTILIPHERSSKEEKKMIQLLCTIHRSKRILFTQRTHNRARPAHDTLRPQFES